MVIVADSSPLISLAILNKLSLLEKLFDDVFIPKAVFEEITEKEKPYFSELKKFSEDKIKVIQNRSAVNQLQRELDLGESEAIVLALENNISDILIDDFAGRKLAIKQGLLPIGTIGVLLQAKRKGLIKSNSTNFWKTT